MTCGNSWAKLVTDRDYDVTGDLTPDAAGYFDIAGIYNGENYLRRHDGAYFVWWDGSIAWYISPVLGQNLPNSWQKLLGPITGVYNPFGGAVGIATITEHHDS